MNNFAELSGCVFSWIEEQCKPTDLQDLMGSILRQVNPHTRKSCHVICDKIRAAMSKILLHNTYTAFRGNLRAWESRAVIVIFFTFIFDDFNFLRLKY